ncbi:HAMP domain-containing sensor histidine kinase [Pedococcus dokdonensis]|nr:HAMP domain-containing sensor histidine kinase [Pedococcus dokdonensis]
MRQAFVDASFVREGLLTSGTQVDDVLASTSPPNGSVLILSRSGQWYSSSLSAGRDAVPAELRDIVESGSAASTWGRLAGEPVLAVGTPLTAVDAVFFEISPARELSSTLATLGWALTAFAALTTVGGALIGRAAARQVIAPLEGMARATARIAGGDVATRLEATGDPDLSVIVGSFNAMVEALQERLDRDARFAADVAHELRSPVTAMMTTVGVLEQASPDPARHAQAVALLRREVHRLGNALEQLLALGRLEAGVDERERQPIELGELLSNALRQTHRAARLLSLPGDPIGVLGDKGALRRTVINLLDNADIHGGGIVRVSLERDGRWAVVVVDDAGPGVPAGERQRIFERFARSGSRAARPGTGLGLSLVSETVRTHGGDVRCGESPDGGARFAVRLPVIELDPTTRGQA